MTGNKFVTSGVSLELDLSEYTRNVNKAISEAGKLDKTLDGLDGYQVGIDISVDDSRVGAAADAINNLDGATPKFDISVGTNQLNRAETTIKNIDNATPSVDVTADTSGVDQALQRMSQQLNTLKQLAVIDIIMNIPANVSDFQNLPVISTLGDIEAQVDRITAQTGKDIPEAAGIIGQLYSEVWGDSRAQIADVIIQLERLGVANKDLESVARTTFQTAAVTGEDPLVVLDAMNKLVANDLVPNFDAAGGFLVTSFQQGLSVSGDLIDSVIEYSKTLKDAGLSAGALFTILDTGLEGGAQNTDYLIDAFKEMLNLTREEVSAFNFDRTETDRTKALTRLGLIDEASAYAAGEITGDQYAAGVLDSLRAVEDPAQQRLLALQVFGPTQVEEAGLPNLLAIDLENSSELSGAWEGVAAEAATALTDNLNGALAEFIKLVETELVTAIDETFDLQGRLDLAKTQFQTFISAIRDGQDLGSAIEIGFGISGTSEFITRFQSIVGNLEIVFLQAVAGIADLVPGDQGEAGIRAEITRLAENQLAFDIAVSNPDEIQGIVQTAINRGVDAAGIGDAYAVAIQEALAAGDLELAARLSRQAGQGSSEPIVIRGIEFAPGSTPEDVMAEFERIANEFQIRGPGVAIKKDFFSSDLGEEVQAFFGLRGGTLTPELQAAAEEAGNLARIAYFEALEAGEVGQALDLASALEDPTLLQLAMQRATEINLAAFEAIQNGDYSLASAFAAQLDDPTLNAEVEALGERLRATAETALAEGDLGLASQIAEDLGDPTLQQVVDDKILKMSELTSLTDDAGVSFTDFSTKASEGAINVADDVPSINAALNAILGDLGINTEAFGTWAVDNVEHVNLLVERLLFAQDVINGMTGDLDPAAAAGTTGSISTNARGGRIGAGEVSWVGEEGPELFTSPQAGSIINAASSSMLMQALNSVGAGGSTYITNNYSINMPTTNHMQNQAQADAYGYRAGKALRGFAS